jgi:UDP-2,3-diacylglucosamine pyrophosphatase LpxH
MNTIIVSDLHLTEAQHNSRHPLWMAYKRKEFFIDNEFAYFLDYLNQNISDKIELVLNGDTFDFDLVLALPGINVDWLSKKRGLSSEEWMSLFKIETIIFDHPIWFNAIKKFIANGNKVIFIVGNHDVELYWPSVQKRICEILETNSIIFCNSFYISGNNTYITHGHQFDPTCVVKDSVNPLININGKPIVRIPFGNLATKYMLNGIGWLNPHCHKNYIKDTVEYFKLFAKYLSEQPLMLWSWFWSAAITLVISLRDHLKPAMIDPLMVEEKVAQIAEQSNATPAMVRKLNALQVPSACSNPINVLRELWLDRGLILLGLLFVAWQIILHINIATHISMLWFFIPFAILLPSLMVYSSSIKSKVFDSPLLTEERAELIVKITGVKNVVMAHTHMPECCSIGAVQYINTGSWAPAFSDAECKNKINEHMFVRIENDNAILYSWTEKNI